LISKKNKYRSLDELGLVIVEKQIFRKKKTFNHIKLSFEPILKVLERQIPTGSKKKKLNYKNQSRNLHGHRKI
jgi:hypothetical protein